MKTFETEKHNIPEGATHYRDECDDFKFSWVIFDDEDLMVDSRLHGWVRFDNPKFELQVKPIPQAKDTEWDGSGLPPVGALCHIMCDSFIYRVMYSSEHVVIVQNLANDNTAAHGMDIILDLSGFDYTFIKPEAEAEKLERERLENGKSLYELVQSLWCTVDSKYIPTPYEPPMVDDKVQELYARLARAVDYKKEAK